MPHQREDVLFELADAILAVDGAAPSPTHLSLQEPHRRGWGSLYAALDRGRSDDEARRKLPAAIRSPTPKGRHPSIPWGQACGHAATLRRRDELLTQGSYYHPSHYSVDKPIGAGWAYQFVAQLNVVRESWTVLMDV
jgi:hypothetical protein